MQFLKDIQCGLLDYLDAIRFIKKYRLYRLFFWTLLGYLTCFLLTAFFIWKSIVFSIDWVLSISFIHSYVSWLQSHAWIILITKIFIYISSFFLFVSVYKYLFLILASPLYAYISEISTKRLTGIDFPFSLNQLLHDIIRGIAISSRNFIAQLLITLSLYALSLIPIIGWLFNLLVLLVDSYYYGFSMFDYNFERDKIDAKTSRQILQNRKGLAIGNGLMMYFSILLPIIGTVIIAPLSVIAAVHTYQVHLKNRLQ